MKTNDPIGTSRKISAIPYYGGKFRLARHIAPIIESIPHNVYCEPFCGGANVFFSLGLKSDVTVINDTNKCLIIMYKAMKLYPKSFLRLLNAIPFSRGEYQYSKFFISNCKTDDDSKDNILNIGVRTYISLCMSFANVMGDDGGWRIDKKKNSDPIQWVNRKSHIKYAIEKLNSTYIDCADFASCIKRWDTHDTLFYIDPPYVGTDLGHYGSSGKSFSIEKFDIDRFRQLCEILNGIKGKYILSCYDINIYPDSYDERIDIPSYKKIGTSGITHDTECLLIKR